MNIAILILLLSYMVSSVRTKQNFPPYSFVNIWVFQTKTTWVNAECRDASKNTLRTVRGSTHKKLFFCMRFSVKSVTPVSYILPYDLAPYSHHTTWQTCLKYTQLFDFGPEISGYTSRTLYPADVAWSQLSKKRIISDQGYMCDWRKLPRRVTSRPEIEI